MNQVLVIVGPTGIGKSELALNFAQKLNGEIISGDSIQVYRDLNIGSAKVSLKQQSLVKHHLIDIYDLEDSYSVALFQEMGRKLISDIIARGKLPIIAGGTGLYIKALLYDYIFLKEEPNPEVVKQVNQLSNSELYQELLESDPESLKEIHINNRQRLLRAVIFNRIQKEKKSEVIASQKKELLYDVFLIGLTLPRAELYKNINLRVDEMIQAGLENEVRKIIADDLQRFNLQALKGIGYKEWQPYFENKASLDEVIMKIKQNSRNLAKRQYTWFNNQMDIKWYDKNSLKQDELFQEVAKWLK